MSDGPVFLGVGRVDSHVIEFLSKAVRLRKTRDRRVSLKLSEARFVQLMPHE